MRVSPVAIPTIKVHQFEDVVMRRCVSGCLVLLFVLALAGCGAKPEKTGIDGSPKPTPPSVSGGTSEERAKLEKAVAEGDALWDAAIQGVKEAKKNKDFTAQAKASIEAKKKYDEAFEKYLQVVNSKEKLSDRNAVARVYGRVIDVALDRKNNSTLAKEVAVKALRQDVLPLTSSEKASAVLDAAKRTIKAEDR